MMIPERATPKQIEFAHEICAYTGRALPAYQTKEAYSQYIDDNIDYYREMQEVEAEAINGAIDARRNW